MSEQDEHIEIDIEASNEVPEIQVVKAEDVPEEHEKPIAPQEGIEELRKQLESERRARTEAEKRAQEAAMQAYTAKNETEDVNLHLVRNAIDTVKRNNDYFKTAYRDAMSVGDYDKAAEAQQGMAANEIKLDQLERGRVALENKPKNAPPAAPVSNDPIESLASSVTPASAQWLRQNKDSLGNEKTIRKMFRAHEDAVDEGIIPDSRQYFDFIESRIGIRKVEPAESDDIMVDTAKVTQRRSAPPAAPVTRSGTAPGTRSNVVRLSSAEREMAQMMGMTDQDYAKNKLLLQKEGKLS